MNEREKTVRKITTRQAAFLQSMPKNAGIEHRRSRQIQEHVGATVGEGPQRSDAGRGSRVSK